MFQFNFNVNSEAESGPQVTEGERGEPPLEWLPAQRHQVTPHHFPIPSDGDVTEITVCNKKIQYLAESFAVKRLQEKGTTCNLSSALENHTDLVPALYEGWSLVI
ncbi:hypothetical protein GWK47_024011 [Chionoecetes opilio]|uniref:Uncharacterized protein n=1 Tax=Chionoecetes opilio TaxID=41210 RepID=A0A8J5CCP8_CHIOP|nr:hypothetical protein GWK47_024011 [Chionoecetes opilio]